MPFRYPDVVLAFAFAPALPAPCRGAQLQVYFSALERILADQVFTQDGRLYMKGDRKNRCNFAYLEKPAVSAANGRLLVQARFSGRSAQNLSGAASGWAIHSMSSSGPFRNTGTARSPSGMSASRAPSAMDCTSA